MQNVSLIGNLTADPVLNERQWTNKETGEILKAKVCNFTVAADEGFGEQKQTQFFRINAWRGLGESCAKYLSKGRAVYVRGPVTLHVFTGKDGNTHATMDIRADAVQFLNDGKGIETPEPVIQDDGFPI